MKKRSTSRFSPQDDTAFIISLIKFGGTECNISMGGSAYPLVFFFLGKSTGIVTNTRITHATPAALYGHSPSRYWEDDSKVPPASRKSCKDLARQLIENDPGRNINEAATNRGK
ncbi:hypothetical protein HHI36_012827 [Cryptolaemus montrouzieri]|uniref:alkaline phosphatase n=1 Tax=Cryptolaemus montrouzieri TaxID=559131 RepID=A0ABD2NGS6_9CUCU